jgi:streptogramin lyase
MTYGAIAVAHDGSVWASDWDYVGRFDGGSGGFRIQHAMSELNASGAYTIRTDNAGNAWILPTEPRLWRISPVARPLFLRFYRAACVERLLHFSPSLAALSD